MFNPNPNKKQVILLELKLETLFFYKSRLNILIIEISPRLLHTIHNMISYRNSRIGRNFKKKCGHLDLLQANRSRRKVRDKSSFFLPCIIDIKCHGIKVLSFVFSQQFAIIICRFIAQKNTATLNSKITYIRRLLPCQTPSTIFVWY